MMLRLNQPRPAGNTAYVGGDEIEIDLSYMFRDEMMTYPHLCYKRSLLMNKSQPFEWWGKIIRYCTRDE